jgi:hypothetical protein
MMINNNIEELLNAIETIRSEKFPELSKELLAELLNIEFENQDNRADAQRKVQSLLDINLSAMIDETILPKS